MFDIAEIRQSPQAEFDGAYVFFSMEVQFGKILLDVPFPLLPVDGFHFVNRRIRFSKLDIGQSYATAEPNVIGIVEFIERLERDSRYFRTFFEFSKLHEGFGFRRIPFLLIRSEFGLNFAAFSQNLAPVALG